MVELEPRPVEIDRLTLVDVPDADTAVFEADCGKGTYVRALARDMGRALGCLGHVIALRRTRVAPFDEAAGREHGGAAGRGRGGRRGRAQRLLLPVEAALYDLAVLSVGQNDAARLLRGQSVLIRGRDAPTGAGPTYATCKGHLIAVGRDREGRVASDPRVQFRRRQLSARNQACIALQFPPSPGPRIRV